MSFTVLIVDDDPMVAMINGQYVNKNKKFKLAGTCRNGQEALDFLKNNKVDLLLLDVYMPVMNGIETLKKIRETTLDLEIIMVTAANDSTTIAETIHLGVLDYLVKPFSYDRFNISLEKYVTQRQMFDDNSVLDQQSIDKLIADSALQAEKDYPKGIQRKTLNLILDYMRQERDWQAVDVIAQHLGVSVVTVRNYMNYLVKDGKIIEDINYETGGRPSMLYRVKI